jgi:hypothetical protein
MDSISELLTAFTQYEPSEPIPGMWGRHSIATETLMALTRPTEDNQQTTRKEKLLLFFREAMLDPRKALVGPYRMREQKCFCESKEKARGTHHRVYLDEEVWA